MMAMIHKTHSSTLLRLAAILGLVALALICWSVLDPRPVPVMLAMSVAQAIGTLSFAMFGWVILRDLVRSNVLSKKPRSLDASKEAPRVGLKPSEV